MNFFKKSQQKAQYKYYIFIPFWNYNDNTFKENKIKELRQVRYISDFLCTTKLIFTYGYEMDDQVCDYLLNIYHILRDDWDFYDFNHDNSKKLKNIEKFMQYILMIREFNYLIHFYEWSLTTKNINELNNFSNTNIL